MRGRASSGQCCRRSPRALRLAFVTRDLDFLGAERFEARREQPQRPSPTLACSTRKSIHRNSGRLCSLASAACSMNAAGGCTSRPGPQKTPTLGAVAATAAVSRVSASRLLDRLAAFVDERHQQVSRVAAQASAAASGQYQAVAAGPSSCDHGNRPRHERDRRGELAERQRQQLVRRPGRVAAARRRENARRTTRRGRRTPAAPAAPAPPAPAIAAGASCTPPSAGPATTRGKPGQIFERRPALQVRRRVDELLDARDDRGADFHEQPAAGRSRSAACGTAAR